MTPTFIVIDLLCGLGGTTLGFVMSGVAKVFACVNHDPNAIKSHWLNHPEVTHFEEDIRTLDLTDLVKLTNFYRSLYPKAKLVLWASLECTHHSKAAGGMSKDADSRTLGEHLDRYVIALDPDYIKIENVTEFKDWGPLKIKMETNEYGGESCAIVIKKDKKNKKTKRVLPFMIPIKELKGTDFEKWRARIKSFGYNDEWKELNSADFGAYTRRNRLFGCFAKHGLPIAWPSPTHAKNPGKNSCLSKWLPVRDVLDFADEGKSIFGRKKDLAPKTMEVIYKGMLKAIKEGNESILFKYYGNGDNLNSIDSPAGTVTTKDRFAKLHFIFRQFKTGCTSSIEEPVGAITTNPKVDLVSFIMNKSHGGHTTSINSPSPVIVARQDKAPLYLIQALMDEKGIIDIKHRMLKIPELLQIQGFPTTYKMFGSQQERKKFIGNIVHPEVPKSWALRLKEELILS